jgi:uroporphyrinogen decarboxylase
MNQKFQNALQAVPQATPPVWMMRQAGRYHKHYQALRAKHGFEELCRIPELAAETTLGPIRDFDFDAAIIFSDLLFPLDALGMGLSYAKGPPELAFQLDEGSFTKLRTGNDTHAELAFQGDAVRACRALLPKDKSLIGFVGGPWTLFVYAADGSHHGSLLKSKKLLPTLFLRFAELVLPLLEYTIARQLEGGAEIVMIFDTAAGDLAPLEFERWNGPWLAKLAKRFPGKLGYYGKNLTEAHLGLSSLKNSPFAGRGVDHRFHLPALLQSGKRTGFLQGNFDQSLLHLEPAQFEEAFRSYLKGFQALSKEERAGWVAGLGHGVLPATPEANVKRYVEILRESFQ